MKTTEPWMRKKKKAQIKNKERQLQQEAKMYREIREIISPMVSNMFWR